MVSMLSIFKRSHLKQSTNLVILCFFLYKLTETLLQYGTRIEIYKTVCIALTNFTKPNENFCSDENYVNEKQQDTRNYEMLTKVQKASGIYLLIYRILLNLPAAIACLIYGVCSNKFGRKISMLIPCLGATIACTLFSASLSPEINLIYGSTTLILIGGTIYGICGKSSAVTMGANSYITDMSSTSNRTRMLGRLLGVNCLGLTIGTLFLALFLTFLSYTEIIIFCIVNNLLIVIILLFFVADSRNEENSPVLGEHSLSLTSTTLSKNEQIMHTNQNGTNFKTGGHKHHHDNVNNSANKQLCESLISIYEQFKLSYNFIFKKYHNEKRNFLLILLGTVLFNQMTKSGEQDIILLYLRNKPTLWTSQLYGFYMACYYGCMFLHLTLFLPIIEHRYTPHDTTLILIGLSLKIFRLLLFSITMNKFWIFFGAIIGSAAGYITSATRSLISKLVKGDEIGASFALISIMETIANLFGGMLFTLVYNYTL
uniref:MFS domain-containing protein n=1 Tax=Trichobilharzia regenti TaxID=157069 RepID=A0AA85IL96_TRIRE